MVTRQRQALKQRLPELVAMQKLINKYQPLLSHQMESLIHVDDLQLPLVSITVGDLSRADKVLLVTGGVHGVERIGTQVILSWLSSLLERLQWDQRSPQQFADDIALVVVPMVNPGGMALNQRSNPQGVDINRHSPINARDRVPWLVGGHRLSPKLPWYRGALDGARATEFQVLDNIISRCTEGGRPVFALDIHSGFGMQDYLWIPYAYRHQPIEDISHYVALKRLWERTYPHHTYRFEPQSLHYLSHGDIWDYFYRRAREQGQYLLPLTLEMGSWRWVKKRPLALFRFTHWFHPVMPHRHSRVLRGHLVWLDFMLSACRNSDAWLPKGRKVEQLNRAARALWYGEASE